MINCNKYETCPKGEKLYTNINRNNINLLFMGCWGVFCSNELIKEQQYGGLSVANLMSEISNKFETRAVILAGDNIYPWYKQKEKENKNLNYYKNIMKAQLEIGFSSCFKNVNTKEYLAAVGNHDIEKCAFINTQINYSKNKWKFPGLYYNTIYRLKNKVIVNLIFIDTNLYTQATYCDSKPFDFLYERSQQFEWLKGVLKKNINSWNIVIGHAPPIYVAHKKI